MTIAQQLAEEFHLGVEQVEKSGADRGGWTLCKHAIFRRNFLESELEKGRFERTQNRNY